MLTNGLPEVELDATIFRPATFIEWALANLTRALLIGCVLVILILVAFLFDWRTAVISLTAIPLSLVAGVLILTWAGASINTMVLAGLVIALGELVDDAIIDVENIVRRVRLNRDVLTYLRERIKEVLTGASAAVVVRVYGPDLDVLRSKAKEIETAIADIEGIANLKVEPQVLVPQVEVRLRPEAAERYGLTAGHIRRAATTLLRGVRVGEIYEGQKKFDVVVWGTPSTRSDLSALRQLPIDAPGGTQVRLMDVAEVVIVPTPNEIKRENASRRLDITCNVAGRDLGAVARDIEAKVRQLSFPREYHPEFLGEYAARQESTRKLYALACLALAGIVLLLFVDFQAWRPTLIVVMTIPFALIGGVFSVLVSGGVLSLGSLVGFVTVLGIAARNGILMVSHFRHLELEEGEAFGPGLVARGAEERLAPILMTASATGLALVPLVVAGNLAGHEIEYPLAIVILGGLFTSTLLNLFLLPPLYAHFGRSAVQNESGTREPVG